MKRMSHEKTKELIQKIVNKVLSQKEFRSIEKVDVFYTFGSSVKTAMCDWVYGIKISKRGHVDNFIISKLQKDIQTACKNNIGINVCCTDIIYSS